MDQSRSVNLFASVSKLNFNHWSFFLSFFLSLSQAYSSCDISLDRSPLLNFALDSGLDFKTDFIHRIGIRIGTQKMFIKLLTTTTTTTTTWHRPFSTDTCSGLLRVHDGSTKPVFVDRDKCRRKSFEKTSHRQNDANLTAQPSGINFSPNLEALKSKTVLHILFIICHR